MPKQRKAAVIRLVIAALFIVFRMEGLADAQPADYSGVKVCAAVTLLEGESTWDRSSMVQQPVVMGEMLIAGSILQTGGGSKVELTFTDNSVVRLTEDSSIELAVDVGNAEKQVERFQVKLLKGEMWVALPDPPEGRNSLQILVGGAMLVGEKSTFRVMLFQDGASEMKVYSGYVTASGPFVLVKEAFRYLLQPAGDHGTRPTVEPWRHRIEPYRKMIIHASGKETKPFRFTAKADLSDWVRWNQSRDADLKKQL